MAILDANVLVRYLVRDDPDLTQRSLLFLERIRDGGLEAVLLEGVIAEVVFVLSSKRLYAVEREVIRDRLLPVLNLPGILSEQKHIYARALDIFVQYRRLSFVDALCVAHAENEDNDRTVLSFDRGFRNIPGLNWVQP